MIKIIYVVLLLLLKNLETILKYTSTILTINDTMQKSVHQKIDISFHAFGSGGSSVKNSWQQKCLKFLEPNSWKE